MTLPRILVIEPYYGGSHRAFLDGLCKHVPADYTLLSLPARKWKMRMQLSAQWCVLQIAQMTEDKRRFDTVLCSTFVDVAVLRALLGQIAGWNRDARFCTYFHENQFAYPVQVDDVSIRQFVSINFTTALSSDGLAFNSAYNRSSFLEKSYGYIKRASDMDILECHTILAEKSRVIYPGIDYSHINRALPAVRRDAPVIVWNHRWEHDKNPEEFFSALDTLQQSGMKFYLIILGQSFIREPLCFSEARGKFASRILHWGYAESASEYGALLRMGDIVVSTSHHEFFGISVLEAVRAGCRPLLPKRLSYPELFPEKYLYNEGQLVKRLGELIKHRVSLSKMDVAALTDPYSWQSLAGKYDEWLRSEKNLI